MKVPGPDHPITITPAEELIVVSFHGQEIACSRRALALTESTYPTAFYIPREDARMELLSASEHHTYCPYKGEASYYSLAEVAGDGLNAVWSYEAPYPAMEQIRGHLAFYSNQVQIVRTPLT
ncbi:DUF427 domain-containing protein [Pseudomonas sp. Pseusp122]|uniref:DUF427 domain-containing protein n=1 Tax=unclassified Pseudomonas TaxID=196821 RepID=UPI0039A763D6